MSAKNNAVLRAWKRRFGKKPSTPAYDLAPWWVRQFTELGRPIMAIVVLAMCAPAEHHLAQVAGFGRLSWGMALTLATYGGMSAAVASYRKVRSARVGAVVAMAAAQAAQATAHLISSHWLHVNGDTQAPTVPWLLVVLVSCAPPLILGHMLHLAWVRPGSGGQYLAQKGRQALQGVALALRPPVVPAGVRLLPLVACTVPVPAQRSAPPALRWVEAPAGTWLLNATPCGIRPAAPMPPESPYLPVSAIAQWTGRSNSTVRGWMSDGRVRWESIDGQQMIDVTTVPRELHGSPDDLAAILTRHGRITSGFRATAQLVGAMSMAS